MYVWLNGGDNLLAFLNTPTLTWTSSPTLPPITDTPTITPTGTITPIPTDAPTATASAPFNYIVQPGDTLFSIAEKFELEDMIIILVMNGLTDESVIFPGDELVIPDPNTGIPTPTSIPPNLRRGDVIDYMVLPGDTVKLIADKFLSTIEGIDEETSKINPDFDINTIYPGQILKVPVRLITPTFGPPPETETNTPAATPTP